MSPAPRRPRVRFAPLVGALSVCAVASVAACALPHEPPGGADARRDTATPREGSVSGDGSTPRPDAPSTMRDSSAGGPDDGVAPPREDAAPPPSDVVVIPPPMDAVTPPPRDVVTPPPSDVPATPIDVPVVVTPDVGTPPPVDVVAPPPDAPRMCGRPGQPCCAGGSCEGSALVCLTFGGSNVCAPCGGLGNACCAGDACGPMSTCRPLYSNAVRACVTNSGRPDRTGTSCSIPLTNCGTNGLLCLGESRTGRSDYAYCVQCGGRGEPCCVTLSGGSCGSGLACSEYPGNVFLCR